MSNLGSVNLYGENTTEDILLKNVISFMKYGLLEMGAYYNIDVGQAGYHGEDESVLEPLVGVDNVTDYTIYKGKKDDWIYEQNIEHKTAGLLQPTIPTGIDLDGTSYPTGSAIDTTGFYVDFNEGQLVFDQPLPSSYVLQVPHSLRWVQIYDKDTYRFRKIDSDWFDAVQGGSTIDSIEEYAYMPCIFVGINSFKTQKGQQLGTRNKIAHAEFEMDVFAANPFDRKQMTDLCYNMETKGFQLFSPDDRPAPLNYRGELADPSGNWKYWRDNYPLNNGQAVRFAENARVTIFRNGNVPIFRSRINISLEADVFPY